MMARGQQTGIPTQAATSHFVIITVGQRLFAIDADAVQGIMEAPDVGSTLVPIFNGDAYQGIDLVSRLAIKSTQEERVSQIVLLMRDHMRGSLRVEQVHGRMNLHPSQILPLPLHFQGAERDWYHGMILFERSVAVILNPAWLLQRLAGIRKTDGAVLERPRNTC